MPYVLAPHGVVAQYPYSLGELRRAYPDTSFSAEPSPESLAAFGVYPVFTVEAPIVSVLERLVELDPVLAGDTWHQVWAVETVSIEERRAAIRPVTMRQARLALLGAGVLSGVGPALASMPSPQREAAEIEWEYASEVRRDAPLIVAIGGALGLSEDEIDDLFLAAAAL